MQLVSFLPHAQEVFIGKCRQPVATHNDRRSAAFGNLEIFMRKKFPALWKKVLPEHRATLVLHYLMAVHIL